MYRAIDVGRRQFQVGQHGRTAAFHVLGIFRLGLLRELAANGIDVCLLLVVQRTVKFVERGLCAVDSSEHGLDAPLHRRHSARSGQRHFSRASDLDALRALGRIKPKIVECCSGIAGRLNGLAKLLHRKAGDVLGVLAAGQRQLIGSRVVGERPGQPKKPVAVGPGETGEDSAVFPTVSLTSLTLAVVFSFLAAFSLAAFFTAFTSVRRSTVAATMTAATMASTTMAATTAMAPAPATFAGGVRRGGQHSRKHKHSDP